MSIRRALPTCLIAVAVAALALAPGASAAPPAATAGKTYVALGDSYAAGYGLPAPATPTFQPVPGCQQTNYDYPHLLAAQLGLALTDVTCAGAKTTDFSSSQDVSTANVNGVPIGGPNPSPQYDIFKTVQPDLVTITIGGNDLGFATIAKECIAASPSGPLVGTPPPPSRPAQTCTAYFAANPSQNPSNMLTHVSMLVGAAVAKVHHLAPNAKIAVIAYPAIAPVASDVPAGTACFPYGLPYTVDDLNYFQQLQQSLDAMIGSQAQANGATYVDIYPPSLPHSACTLPGTRWVAGLLTPDPGGYNVLHPTLLGVQAMADALAPVVTALLTPAPAQSGQSGQGNGAAVAVQAVPVVVPMLANTGPVPIWPLLALAALLLVSGAAILRSPLARRATADPHS